jgi:hypothetical protein
MAHCYSVYAFFLLFALLSLTFSAQMFSALHVHVGHETQQALFTRHRRERSRTQRVSSITTYLATTK